MVYSKVLKLYAMKGGYYKMQAKMNGWMQFVLCALLVASIVMSGFAMNRDLEVSVSSNDIAEAVLNGLPVQDNSNVEDLRTSLNKLCELTEGCEFFSISDSEAGVVRDVVEDEDEEFMDAFSELVGIEDKYLNIRAIELKDTQVRAYSENDKDDENFEVKLFYRIKFRDSDETESEYAYVLVTSELDEGDFDGLSLELVGRNFEFD